MTRYPLEENIGSYDNTHAAYRDCKNGNEKKLKIRAKKVNTLTHTVGIWVYSSYKASCVIPG